MAPLGSLAVAAAAGAAAAVIAAVVGGRYLSNGAGGAVTVAARIAALEQEAARLHEAAKQHNLKGDFEGAKAAYRQMYGVEDEALRLAVAAPGEAKAEGSAEEAVAAAEYASLMPLPAGPWADRATQRRAVGAVMGAVVADAAAMGVHWVYDPKELNRLYDLRRSTSVAQSDEDVGLDFHEPPQSPFFSYEGGRASPYGEQTLALLASLVDQRGLHPLQYAEALACQFGTGWDGYRDTSLKGFLRNWYRGHRPPHTGALDWQANCFTRLAPIVAAYHAGSGGGGAEGLPLVLTAVERATRVTQNADRAVAWARAGAAVLARVISGSSVDDAVAAVMSELADAATVLGADARFRELNGEMAGYMRQVHDMAHQGQSVHATVAALGRNCHLPNSFQTPLHAALLYSLPAGSAGGVKTMTAAERQRVYKAAVRAALREGGCCASRATYIGACLGAWLAGGAEDGLDFLPPEWVAKVTGFERTRGLAEALVGFSGVN